MADPFLSEIRIFSFNFAPRGWALCNGQILNINQNNALYSLLSTMYGGDGKTTFALPDLRGRVAKQISSSIPQGRLGGSESVTLTVNQIPAHTHTVVGTSVAATSPIADGLIPAVASTRRGNIPNLYTTAGNMVPLNPATVDAAGNSAQHNNCQPSLVLNFCIATTGIYPPRS